MHMISRKDLNSAELETVRISKSPTTVVTANGEVQTRKEATLYVREVDIRQFFHSENSAKNLGTVIIGQVARNHISSRKAGRSTATQNYVPFVVPGLSTSSSTSSSPTSPTSSSQETVTPTEHPASTRSESMSDEVQGNLSHGPAETENPNKNEDNEKVRGNLSHDLPGLLQEFRHGLVDKSVPEHRDAFSSSHDWLLSGSNLTHVKRKLLRKHKKRLQKFLERTRKPKVIYTDKSPEFGKSCEELYWNHCTSTPHRSETNGIAERAVRRVKEGTSAVLLQSGLDEKWCADSMECCCCLRNMQDLLSDGKTPYERRFGVPFNGPVIPFGAMVEYHPISAKDQSRIHQFAGLFLGYRPIPTASVWSKSLARYILWICVARRRNLERRHLGRRH